MDLYRIISDLVDERNRLERLIQSLGGMARDGRNAVRTPMRRGRKSMDGAGRREVSERMTRYWARRRDEKAAALAARAPGPLELHLVPDLVPEHHAPPDHEVKVEASLAQTMCAESAAMTNVASA